MGSDAVSRTAAAKRRYWIVLVVLGAVIGVILIAIPIVHDAREQAVVAALARPVPPPSATSTASSSSSPTASATVSARPKPRKRSTQKVHPTAAASPGTRVEPTAAPQPATSATPIVPSQIFIPDIQVNTQVVAKPSEFAMDDHLGYKVWQFGVPTGSRAMYQVAWWSSGPKPGASGKRLAVLLGHTWIGGYGVFNNLSRLQKGAPITLESRDGKILRLEVLETKNGISKTDPTALQSVLENAPARATVALVTCSGSVNKTIQSHEDNTVVFAGLA